jgi:DNA-binding winged helix-turn-helix (wHTH) protein/tetratricopeptide (TPR) repeat protein
MSGYVPRFYDFGPFRIDATQHLLLRDGIEVPLTPKAFDTLLLLVRNNGQIVEKDALLKTVWPEAFVEEATLAQNIFTIRKALGGSEGDQYIQTIPKRGYRFVAGVVAVKDESGVQLETSETSLLDRIGEKSDYASPIVSVAVLPLINQSADQDVGYLSDGLTEALTNTLSLLPELQVKACSTVLRYKGLEINPQHAGQELGVVAVLTGRLHQIGDELIIRMELVDSSNGWQLWGEEYKRKLSEIHNLQTDITKDISENLRLKLTGEEWERLAKTRAYNAQGFQFYLKGRAFLNKRTKDAYKKAIDSFEQAIEIDPTFALAHSGLADSYILYDFYGLIPPWNTIPKARAAAVQAVALADELAESHTSLGSITLIHDRDLVGAEREFKRAIRLNQKYARAHDGYAHCLLAMGHTEDSLAECNLALELEPFDVEINQHVGWYYLFARQYDRAIEQLQKTLEMQPDYYRARVLLGIAYGQKGAYSQAIAEFLQARVLEETTMLSGFLGYAYGMSGDKKKALEIVNSMLEEAKQRYVQPYSFALVYTGLDRYDEALTWIERAFVEHGHWRGWLELTPELDSLRAHPRFIELLQRNFSGRRY